MAPLLLSFVLDKPLEESLHRALLVHDGSFAFLCQRPVTAVLVALSIACLLAPAVTGWWRKRRRWSATTTVV